MGKTSERVWKALIDSLLQAAWTPVLVAAASVALFVWAWFRSMNTIQIVSTAVFCTASFLGLAGWLLGRFGPNRIVRKDILSAVSKDYPEIHRENKRLIAELAGLHETRKHLESEVARLRPYELREEKRRQEELLDLKRRRRLAELGYLENSAKLFASNIEVLLYRWDGSPEPLKKAVVGSGKSLLTESEILFEYQENYHAGILALKAKLEEEERLGSRDLDAYCQTRPRDREVLLNIAGGLRSLAIRLKERGDSTV